MHDCQLTHSPEPMDMDIELRDEWDDKAPIEGGGFERKVFKYERIQRKIKRLYQKKRESAEEQVDTNHASLCHELEIACERWSEFMGRIQVRTEKAIRDLKSDEAMKQIDLDFWQEFHSVNATLDYIDFELDQLPKGQRQEDPGDISSHEQEEPDKNPIHDIHNTLARMKLQTDSDAEDEWMYATAKK